MADAKITALTEDTTPLNTDLAVIVEDPAGTAVIKKITLLNLQRGLYTKVATLAADVVTAASTTPVTLTGLVWTMEANAVYMFRWIGSIQSAAATTGAGFQLDVSVAVTEIAMTFYHQLANVGTTTGGSSTADDASLGVSSGTPTLATNVPVSGQGLVRVGATGGTAQLRFRSEAAAITTAKTGLTLVVERVA